MKTVLVDYTIRKICLKVVNKTSNMTQPTVIFTTTFSITFKCDLTKNKTSVISFIIN